MPNLTSDALSKIRERAEGAFGAMKQNKDEIAAHAKIDVLHVKMVDVKFQFIGANGIPKMDTIGTADPYFIANVDGVIKYTSTVQMNTLSPVWNEQWHLKNVPAKGKLSLTVHDKDDGKPVDDYIGKCETDLEPGTKELTIAGHFKRPRGVLWLKIEVSEPSDPSMLPYTFDGPVRFYRHFSPTIATLTNLPDRRLYSTWKIYIKGVSSFFGGHHQHWNTSYVAAQKIFTGPGGIGVRAGIQAGHSLLYARTTSDAHGTIESAADVKSFLTGGKISPHRVKPAVYTYVIASDDDSFRFSETGAAFFVDFASKHALHANCQETVRYSGEFHPRPEGGWENFNESMDDTHVKWELVIDNNSGTYAPDKTLLPQLRKLLEYNFPDFNVITYDFHEDALTQSREACRAYATKYRGVTATELQPAKAAGEETLAHSALSAIPHGGEHSSDHSQDAPPS